MQRSRTSHLSTWLIVSSFVSSYFLLMASAARALPAVQFGAIYSFTGASGANPSGSVVFAATNAGAGFFGTTVNGGLLPGGVSAYGTVFQVVPTFVRPGPTPFPVSVKGLHAFAGNPLTGNQDGDHPYDSLMLGANGLLFGDTENGGAGGYGTIFQIGMTGANYQVLYSLNMATGIEPVAGLLQGPPNGTTYGACTAGGPNGTGTLVSFIPGAALSPIHAFGPLVFPGGVNADGAHPTGTPVFGPNNDIIYGTCFYGGRNGTGVVFSYDWVTRRFAVLHHFGALTNAGTNVDGANPYAGLALASNGLLYGVTTAGGRFGYGTIYSITTAGAFTTRHDFRGPDGARPMGVLLQASNGNLYGTASAGGANGTGSIFQMTPGGAFLLLASFAPLPPNGGANSTGATPIGGLVEVAPNLLGGAASLGGQWSDGTLYAVALLPRLTLTAVNVTQAANGSYDATVIVQNTGPGTAFNASITGSTLGPAATSTALPINLGNLAPGSTAATTVAFPANAGPPGTTVMLKLAGAFTGGTWKAATRVNLP